MRNKFEEQLEVLNAELTAMGALCESAIANAAWALLEGDNELAKQAIFIETAVDQKERDIEGLCLKLLLQQQPVAKDLRLISSALKMITDMERIGDQAADISELVTFTVGISAFTGNVHIGDMARATIKMVTDSINAFVKRDFELAQAIIEYDDVVDNLFNEIKSEIIGLIGKDPKNGEYCIDLLMIAKYFERIGDHAVNIAEWVEFSLTGMHKE